MSKKKHIKIKGVVPVVVPALSIDRLSAVLDRALAIAESNPEAAKALAAIVQASAVNDIASRLDTLAQWTAFVKSAPLQVLLGPPVHEPLVLLCDAVARMDGHAGTNHNPKS